MRRFPFVLAASIAIGAASLWGASAPAAEMPSFSATGDMQNPHETDDGAWTLAAQTREDPPLLAELTLLEQGKRYDKPAWQWDGKVAVAGRMLFASPMDKSPQRGPTAVVLFKPKQGGEFQVRLDADLKIQTPDAGHAIATLFILRGDRSKGEELLQVSTESTHRTENHGKAEVVYDQTLKLEAGDEVGLRVQSYNPGPASAGWSYLIVNRFEISEPGEASGASPATSQDDVKDPQEVLAKPAAPPTETIGVSDEASGLYSAKGPIGEEYTPDLIIEDFDGPAKYSLLKFKGQANVQIVPQQAIGKDSTTSLEVRIDPPANPDARHEWYIVWNFDEPQDWSEYDSLTLWHQALPGLQQDPWLVITDSSGRWFRWRRDPDPSMIGQWRLLQLSIRPGEGAFMPEGGGSGGKFDPSSVTSFRVRLWGRVKEPVRFRIDGIGLAKPRPAYDEPTVELNLPGGAFVRQPDGDDFVFNLRTDHLRAGRDVTVRVLSEDYWGEIQTLKELNLPTTGQTVEMRVVVPNDQVGWRKIRAVLSVDGKDVYQDWVQVASIRPQAPEDRQRNEDSIFGVWVGGGQEKIGAKWSRYIAPGTEVSMTDDGRYQLRDGPPGAYRPFPRYNETPGDNSLNYLICLDHMPRFLWSRPEHGRDYPPTDYGAYEDYVAWVARGAKESGLRYFEIWNEPGATWNGSMEEFVRLCEATYKGIKRVHPGAVVTGPSNYGFTPDFHEQFFAAGGGQWIDALCVHTYTSPPPEVDFRQGLRQLRRIMAKHGLGDLDIYISEMSYSVPRVSLRQQAQYMVQAYVVALSEDVRVLNWHKLWNQQKEGSDGTELSERNGEPRPAYAAYAAMTRVLEQAEYAGHVPNLTGSQNGYVFRKDGDTIWVLWDNAGSRVELDAPATEARQIDLMGRESVMEPAVDGRYRFELTANPVFIRLTSP